MSAKGSAIPIVAILLAAVAIAVNFAIPGPQGAQGPAGPAGQAGTQGPPGPAGPGTTPKVQKLRIELGEGEIVQEVQGKEELAGDFHRWEPDTLVVRKGDTVELTVVNPRHNTHSFTLSAYNVDTGPITGRDLQPDVAKRTVTVKFVADKAGVFKYECAIKFDEAKKECNPDHARMVGYLTVLDV
ncbi:MAG: hypothetical protein HYU39_09730 [Thaumarchaeota archaeon]|nr:hypothetical protein [Nitrososphaerota archaeon]